MCLCTGATSHAVADAVACGASTCKEVAEACGAGSDCGRCRRTVRTIIATTESALESAPPNPLSGNDKSLAETHPLQPEIKQLRVAKHFYGAVAG